MSLPGVRTVLRDQYYLLSRQDIFPGPRIVVIARRNTADNFGSVRDYDPVRLATEQQVIAAFGQGSELHRAFIELMVGGAQNVLMVAIPSTVTDAELLDYTADGAHPFDMAFEAAEATLPDIIVPWGRGGHPLEWENPATPGNDPKFGFYADNSTTVSTATNASLAYNVSKRCFDIAGRSKPCFAIMGLKPAGPWESSPILNQSLTPAEVKKHYLYPNLMDRDATLPVNIDGTTSACLQYLQVVSGEVTQLNYTAEWGYANAACAYAGAIATLTSWSATTGKNIFNVGGVRYNPSRTQQESLIGRGIVPVALNYARVPFWVDGLTFAPLESDYTRLSTLRIVIDTVLSIRTVGLRFIGEPMNIENRNAFETAITAALAALQREGALLGSDFHVTYVPRQYLAIVDLVLQPAFELRNIDLRVSINF